MPNSYKFRETLTTQYPEAYLSARDDYGWADYSTQEIVLLSHALTLNPSLKKVSLWTCNVKSQGAQALAQNTTLTSLNLGSNKVGDAEAVALAQNTIFRGLDLMDNHVGDVGAVALFQNTTFTSLDLWGNHVGDKGRKAFHHSPNPHFKSVYNILGSEFQQH